MGQFKIRPFSVLYMLIYMLMGTDETSRMIANSHARLHSLRWQYLHLAVNRISKGKEKEKKERDEREESKLEAYRMLMSFSVFALD